MSKPTYKERNGTTRVGDALRWLVKNGKSVAPNLLDIAGDITGVESLNKLSDMISGDKSLSNEDKDFLLKQLEYDMIEMREISSRWSSDMSSDSFLSKNIRPMSLMFLTVSTVLLIYLDSFDISIEVPGEWIELLKSLLLGVYIAYFGSRGVEKYKSIGNK
jgi:hypothetical protein